MLSGLRTGFIIEVIVEDLQVTYGKGKRDVPIRIYGLVVLRSCRIRTDILRTTGIKLTIEERLRTRRVKSRLRY